MDTEHLLDGKAVAAWTGSVTARSANRKTAGERRKFIEFEAMLQAMQTRRKLHCTRVSLQISALPIP